MPNNTPKVVDTTGSKQPALLPTSLEDIERDAWTMLARAVTDRKHAYHQPTLASVEFGEPRVRTVVLRRVLTRDDDQAGPAIVCHTDVRSPKAAQLRETPVTAWHFYDAAARVQLRVTGSTRVLTQADADELGARLWREAWERTALFARRCYLAPIAPSSSTSSPTGNMPDELKNRAPTQEESDPGRDHFAVLVTTATHLDWLALRHDGHRRAGFRYEKNELITSDWLAP